MKQQPKKKRALPEGKVNATMVLERTDWELFEEKAQNIGMSRSQLMTLICRGDIDLKTIQLKNEEQVLGES